MQKAEPLLPANHSKPDPYRFVILFLFCLSTLVVSLSFFGFSSIATSIQKIYGLSSLLVNLYSLGYMITNLVVGIPISYCLSYYSIRTNVLLMMLLGVTGSWVRCLVNSSFYFAFIGQYVLGASFSFYRGLVTRISSIWFPPEMRATSTAIMFTCLLTADTLSLFLPTYILPLSNNSQTDYPALSSRVSLYFLILACVATLVGIVVVIFMREKPSHPVSLTAAISRLQFCPALKTSIKNTSFLLLMIATGFSGGVGVSFGLTMEQILSPYGVDSTQIGHAAIIGLIFIIAGSLGSSYLAGKYNKFKSLSLLFVALQTIFYALLIILLHSNLNSYFAFFQISLSVCTISQVTLSLQFAAQVSFPVPEAFTSSIITVFIKLMTVLLTLLASHFVTQTLNQLCIIMYFSLQFLSCFFLLFVKDTLRRKIIDETDPQNQKL